MFNVEFIYNGDSLFIQTNENENMKRICMKYFMKEGFDRSRTYSKSNKS